MTALPPIVGIGASAGGLEALQHFVGAIPEDSGIAYVVVQHLAPDQPSLTAKLLRSHAWIPVAPIEDGGRVRPDTVHVIPPGLFLEIKAGRFRLVAHAPEEGVRTPIDRFFGSLSEALGRKAFAVVLSGTGSDGTMGVRAIKSRGGIALVQESGSARFPGMPDSAAATGLVDFTLRPVEMPARIAEIARHRRWLDEDVGRAVLLEQIEAGLGDILRCVEAEAGHSFSGYKPGTLIRRVARRMTLIRRGSVAAYLEILRDAPSERRQLAQDFLIGVTEFFRDPSSFEVLRDTVLAPLLDRDGEGFRIWVPGCSTGEEAYSIAILMAELTRAAGDPRPWKIFGTDIDRDALRFARAGRYAAASVAGLDPARREAWLARDDDSWLVDPRLRETCVFAPHNLLSDPPFSKLDLISCRNVMIYLTSGSQRDLLPRFHYALNPGGHLWLGPSETVSRGEQYFEAVDPGAKLYRRNDSVPPALSVLARMPSGSASPVAAAPPRRLAPDRTPDAQTPERQTAGTGRDGGTEPEVQALRRRLSAAEREYEEAARALQDATEALQSSNEELETTREEFQSINEELETINAELTENNRQIARANSDLKNLLESTDIATVFIDDTDRVRLFTPELGRLFGVQDRDLGRSIHDLASRIDYPDLRQDAAQVRRTLEPLEREVRVEVTDETFAMRIRPYRTIDGALDGVVITFVDVTDRKRNEKQLETNARILAEQYSELETLYDRAPIGLNLLTRDLKYLRINETLAAINGFPVEAHIGRYQKDLVPDAHAAVHEIQKRVIATGQAAFGIEVRATTPARPNETRDFVVDFYPVMDGDTVFALGTCTREVTNERALERRIAESAMRQRVAVEAAGLGVFEWDMAQDHAVWDNDRMYEILGRDTRDDPISLDQFTGMLLHADDVAALGRAVVAAKSTGTFHEVFPIHRESDGALRHVEYFGRVITSGDAGEHRMFGVVADVTDQTLAAEREREQRTRLRRLQDSLNAFVGLLSTDGTVIEANAAALLRGGLTRGDVIGKKFWECWWWSYDEASQERLKQSLARVRDGETLRYDVPVRIAGGEMIVIDFQMVPGRDEAGRIIEIVPSGVDVTERVEAEARKDMLLAELEHRVKNTLTTIQAITRMTARKAETKQDMAQSLIDRLAAISRTHEALTASDWEGQSLRRLLGAEIAPYVDPDGGRFVYAGPDLQLTPREAMSLGLALHELATNAAKYGAFSNADGRVDFGVTGRGRDIARLEWRETGGPPVAAPMREGFGTFLIQSLLARELDADIRIEYQATGVHCVIERKDRHHI